ncbi:TetR/AcrR family transcriptional regulator [Corynebacterium macclintockiae]|uniref:TetR family transcriptional regulator n=1 Tax=Bowdeniella nasicola TaxID=208480 RepID=A0A1Q5Q047_9ACTO|nr:MULTISPECIES: TetR/AcrR family transcriptional regulator [Actinomycetes]OKL53251.1 TetR family transcriptional regulator [Bowdeniella nasicola]PMC74249.1 TetR/AcrR family transcriptional regulator [Brachybacterium sp. UMB0905]
MRRTAEDAAKTRVALLDAALRAFEEKGWRGATFEHVAECAGVTRGALNHHFRDKQTLLIEALEWGWSDYGQRLFSQNNDSVGTSAHEALKALLADFTRLLTRDERFRALASTTVLVAPQALEHSERNSALDEWHERIEGLISMPERDTARPGRREIASLVLVLLQGFTVTAVTRPQDIPQPDELDTALTALVRGLLDS